MRNENANNETISCLPGLGDSDFTEFNQTLVVIGGVQRIPEFQMKLVIARQTWRNLTWDGT